MRVFCPEHKRGFFSPRQNPIRCENRDHVLGELNFAGDDHSQVQLQWQYCCNCEHFCPISAQGESLERCLACTRRASLLYVCDRCFTISFESDTPLQTKNFTVTSAGLPDPSCPGCLLQTSGEVREHYCDELHASFTTALNSCPICGERLDVGPSFPSLIEPYLRKTKAKNKIAATFDYDSGLFVAVEDGEFVVVPNEAEHNQSFLLPRVTHFSKSREFYEIYQDYYHHRAELRSGVVFIHEPALVQPKHEGWEFQSAGLLEVVDDQPKARVRKIQPHQEDLAHPPSPGPATAPAEVEPGEIETFSPDEAASPKDTAPEEVRTRSCSGCGAIVEEKYSFCWHCGSAMKPVRRAGKSSESARPPREHDGRGKGLRA